MSKIYTATSENIHDIAEKICDIVENKLHLHLIADFLAENNNFVGRKK